MSQIIELHSCALEKSTMSFPMGALCIKTAINLESTIPNSVLFDHYLDDCAEDEAKKTVERNCKIVGLSMYIWNNDWMEKFAKTIKKLSPDTVIFAGGPEVSAFRTSFPDYLDFAVFGEGEVTTVECLKKHFNGNTPKGFIESTLPDLDKQQSPFLLDEALPQLESTNSVLWEMSRGCPFCCAFCFESRGNRKVRNYPIERIKDELSYLIKHNVENVFVLDPTFNLNQERAKEILKYLVENSPSYLHFTFEVRAELLDEEMAQLFGNLNCSLQLGLQSSDKDILSKIGRNFDKEDFKEKTSLLTANGVPFGLDIIIGLPDDNINSFRKTVNYATSLMPSNIDCFVLSLLPGTELSEKAKELGLEVENNSMQTLKSSKTFTKEDISDALAIKESMDLFYTKGQACMWLHCVLEALNITACNLFSLFSKWMTQTNRSSEEDIWVLQDDFISSLFEKTQNSKLIPAIKSFMELHQGMTFVTDTEQSVQLDLAYHIDDLALLDKMSLSEFVKTKKPHHCTPTVTLEDGCVVFY